uniref:Uncharacterized protein n=1 Tax=Anopheles dirus TaxID=7168 RepID=A0A182NU58_9DIPT
MAELQQLNEFISQIVKPERTIKCSPDGVDFERFAAICDLPGATNEVRQTLQSSLPVLRNCEANEDAKFTAATNIVTVVIENVKSFVTLEHYCWLVRTMVAAQLLKELPTKVYCLVRRLCTTVEGIDVASFNYSPDMVHTLAMRLKEDIPLNDINLLFIIEKFAITTAPVLYYTAVALLFAGLDAITQPDKRTEAFRVHTMADFLRHLEMLNVQQLQQLRHNLQNLYQLLKLFSLYQNMVVMRHVGKSVEGELADEHKCYAAALHVTNDQVQTFRQWLENSSALVQPFGNEQDEDYLILADLIQVDMIPLFDDLNQPHELV